MRRLRQIRIEGDLAYVPLTRDFEAVIDASDVHLIEGTNWQARPDGRTVYARRSQKIDGTYTSILMHRKIMKAKKGQPVDHINGNGLDNRKANLRTCTVNQNAFNTGPQINNTSGFKGVTAHKGKWQAQIKVCGKNIYLGLFESPDEAGAAYDAAAREQHAQFAYNSEASS